MAFLIRKFQVDFFILNSHDKSYENTTKEEK